MAGLWVTGDTHRDYNRMAEIIKRMEEGDATIIAGDFGYLFFNDKSENCFLDDIEALPYTILFIDGNHENFPAIYSYPEEIWNGGKIHRIRKNIIHLCRGQVFEIEGKKIFTFGGGYSIDKAFRITEVIEGDEEHKLTWWKEEMPTQEELDEGLKNLEKHNWTVDYIITHTLNGESIKELARRDRYSEIKGHFTEESFLNGYLDNIQRFTNYKEWFFGHFHRNTRLDYFKQTGLFEDMIKIN